MSKQLEILRKLSIKKSFIEDVDKLRKRFGVPKSGSKFIGKGEYGKFQKDSQRILIKHGVPPVFGMMFEKYIFTGEIDDSFWVKNWYSPLYLISKRKDKCDWSKQYAYDQSELPKNFPYVDLRISDLASKDETLKYLENNWEAIEMELKLLGGNPGKRYREKKNWKRDETIYQLSLLKKPDLRELARDEDSIPPPSNVQKDQLIARIINKEFEGNVSPENVRRIIDRQKKLRSL